MRQLGCDVPKKFSGYEVLKFAEKLADHFSKMTDAELAGCFCYRERLDDETMDALAEEMSRRRWEDLEQAIEREKQLIAELDAVIAKHRK